MHQDVYKLAQLVQAVQVYKAWPHGIIKNGSQRVHEWTQACAFCALSWEEMVIQLMLILAHLYRWHHHVSKQHRLGLASLSAPYQWAAILVAQLYRCTSISSIHVQVYHIMLVCSGRMHFGRMHFDKMHSKYMWPALLYHACRLWQSALWQNAFR